jgi:hypothetical protein
MITVRHWLIAVFAATLVATTQPTAGQLFESDSKRYAGSKMDIVVREEERRPRASVLSIVSKTRGSSVGASLFVLCSIHTMAQLRGNFRYIVKVEDHPKRGEMLVGFLMSRDESLEGLGEDFRGLKSPQDVIDLEQFTPVCDLTRR